jgi:hypothetical protein
MEGFRHQPQKEKSPRDPIIELGTVAEGLKERLEQKKLEQPVPEEFGEFALGEPSDDLKGTISRLQKGE